MRAHEVDVLVFGGSVLDGAAISANLAALTIAAQSERACATRRLRRGAPQLAFAQHACARAADRPLELVRDAAPLDDDVRGDAPVPVWKADRAKRNGHRYQCSTTPVGRKCQKG